MLMQTSVCHMETPLGIDVNPVFSWVPVIKKGEDFQKAYRLIVSSESDIGEAGIVWDSGLVASTAFTEVSYEGSSLESATTYFWQVTSYCESGVQKSQVQSFQTGFFRQDEWEGIWIGETSQDRLSLGGANWISLETEAETSYFRKKISLNKEMVKKITIGLKGNDQVILYVNGNVVGKQAYRYTGCQYDVTKQLVSGENLLAIVATTDFDRPAGVIVTVQIEDMEGHLTTLISDDSWQGSALLLDGWQGLEFEEKLGDWQPATILGRFGDIRWGDNISLESEHGRAAVRLSKKFEVTKKITSAFAYVCGLGFFELSVNGQQADDTVMNPFNSQFNQRVLYRTFDLTKFLERGENVLGLELGNGFYNEIGGVWNWATASWRDNPKARLNVVISYADGSRETIVTNESWKVSIEGPTVANSYYYGEVYDARKEQLGWNQVSYEESDWAFAREMVAPRGQLSAQLKAPVKEITSFKPKKIQQLANGSYLVSGQEMAAGWLELSHINEVAGTELTLTYGQVLTEDGSVRKYGGTDGEMAFWWPHAYLQQDKYRCKGTGDETFKPKYSYKGHQYVQIDGLTTELTENDVMIYRTSNDIPVTSHFSCSNPLFNELHQMMKRAMVNNFHGDHCDPVIEKIGWTGDANVSLDCLMFNYDMRGSLMGWLQTMEDGFDEYGIVPLTAPTADWGIENYVVWNSLFVYGVQYLDKHFGTTDYVKQQYPAMSRYVLGQIEVLRKNQWVWPDNELGDWVAPIGGADPNSAYDENTSEGSGITGTAMIYGVLVYMEELAQRFGVSSEVRYYQEVRQKIYDAFQRAYYKPKLGYYQTNTWKQIGSRTRYRQTDNLLPLAFDLVPEECLADVVVQLVEDIQKKGEHLDTGCVGTRYILPVLSKFGYSDLAYRIANQKSYPSWGFWVENEASSTWEMWESSTRSYDHYFLGTYDEWFYSHLAGIQEIRNGYQEVTIQPEFITDLDWVTCQIETVRGRLGVNWQRSSTGLSCQIDIPFGTQAQIVLPFPKEEIDIDGGVVSSVENQGSPNGTEGELTRIMLGAGSYHLVCES